MGYNDWMWTWETVTPWEPWPEWDFMAEPPMNKPPPERIPWPF